MRGDIVLSISVLVNLTQIIFPLILLLILGTLGKKKTVVAIDPCRHLCTTTTYLAESELSWVLERLHCTITYPSCIC